MLGIFRFLRSSWFLGIAGWCRFIGGEFGVLFLFFCSVVLGGLRRIEAFV